MPTRKKTSTLEVTAAELQLLRDAVDSYETVAEDAVHEYNEQPPSYLETYRRLHRKVRKL